MEGRLSPALRLKNTQEGEAPVFFRKRRILTAWGLIGALSLLNGGRVLASDAEVLLQSDADSSAYHLEGRFAVAADAELVWDVLTDYENMGQFVSSIRSSRVVRQEPGGPVIEQEGSGKFLFLSRRVKLTLAVREDRPARIDFRDIEGDRFRKYEGSWRIFPSSSGCIVQYELTAEPDPSLGPKFATKKVLRKNAQRLLEEVRLEIQRRRSERQDD